MSEHNDILGAVDAAVSLLAGLPQFATDYDFERAWVARIAIDGPGVETKVWLVPESFTWDGDENSPADAMMRGPQISIVPVRIVDSENKAALDQFCRDVIAICEALAYQKLGEFYSVEAQVTRIVDQQNLVETGYAVADILLRLE